MLTDYNCHLSEKVSASLQGSALSEFPKLETRLTTQLVSQLVSQPVSRLGFEMGPC